VCSDVRPGCYPRHWALVAVASSQNTTKPQDTETSSSLELSRFMRMPDLPLHAQLSHLVAARSVGLQHYVWPQLRRSGDSQGCCGHLNSSSNRRRDVDAGSRRLLGRFAGQKEAPLLFVSRRHKSFNTYGRACSLRLIECYCAYVASTVYYPTPSYDIISCNCTTHT